MQLGIYERIIQKSEVDQLNTYNKLYDFKPYLELNYLYLRFDFSSKDSSKKDSDFFVIGKVFMSERYVESDYYDKFRNTESYSNNNDGFFYYCKLYFDKQNLDYRLIIYPNYIQNICKPYMHLNKKTCTKGDVLTHDKSIKALIAIPEAEFEDVVANNISNEAIKDTNEKEFRDFFKLNNEANFVFFDDAKSILKQNIRTNSYPVVINLSKALKIFRFVEGKNTNILRLSYSKNENNEDFTYNLQYDYIYHKYEDLPTIADDISFTQNKDNKNLIYSLKPDDHFYTGKKRVFDKITFDSEDSCTKSDNYEDCIIKSIENIKQALEEKRRVSDKIKFELDSMKKSLKYSESEKKNFEELKTKGINNLNAIESKTKFYDELNKNLKDAKDFLGTQLDFSVDSFEINFKKKYVNAQQSIKVIYNEYDSYKDTKNNPFQLNLANNENIKSVIDSINIKFSKYKSCMNAFNASLDSCNTNFKTYNTSILKSYLDTYSIDVSKVENWITTFQKELKDYQQYLEIEKVIIELSKKLNESIKEVGSLQINLDEKENIFSRHKKFKDNTFYFIYIDKPISSQFLKDNLFDTDQKFNFYQKLFFQSFYIRNDIPLYLDSSKIYEKGRILEIYEPFNYSKKYIKTIFKNRTSSTQKRWKKQMMGDLYEVLSNNTFEIKNDLSEIYKQTNKSTFFLPFTAEKQYFWLKITNNLKENIEYMNFLFNHKPQRFARYVRKLKTYAYKPL